VASLLLVEDDERISQPLVRLLQHEGFEVTHVATGHAGLAAAQESPPDLVLLDLSLPDLDGLEVCRSLRSTHPAMPIVMLTARGEEVDIIVGLDAGADDYIAKPFRVGELVARIRARLRIAAAGGGDASDAPTSSPGSIGLHVDAVARRVWMNGAEIVVSPKEFDLLAYLWQHRGATVRREQIMSDVWDENWWGSTRTLDTHVAALRRKLGDVGDPPQLITTVRGVGLRLEDI
jgi:DNA-binding response OmpR family regulator